MPQSRIEQYYDKRQIRQYILGFTAVFTSIQINKNELDDTPDFRQVPVKIAGASRVFASLNDPDLISILPIINIELTGLEYGDKEYFINKHSYITDPVKVDQSGNALNVDLYNTFHIAPYKFNWSVYILSGTMRDAFIILEQILPVFNPEMYINIQDDIFGSYNARTRLVSVTDNSDKLPGASDKDRKILYTLGFQTQGRLHKFKKNMDTVKVVNTKFYRGDKDISSLLSTIIEESEIDI